MTVGAMPEAEDVLLAALTRREALRRLGLSGLALAAPTALAACGGNSSPTTSTTSKGTSSSRVDKLTWMVLQLEEIDVTYQDSSLLVIEPILKFDAKLNIVGHLAESWRLADPVTYVYKIREGVKYWDGSVMTPQDIVYGITRHTDPKQQSILAGIIPPLKSVEVTGPHEVTVTLEKPNATWAYVPTSMLITPEKFHKRLGKDFGAPKPGSVMGTGPYKVVEFKADDHLDLEENPDYWGPTPVAKKLSIKVVRDAQVRLLAMRSGDVDGTFDIQAATADDWKQLPNANVTSVPTGNFSFFSFFTTDKPWDDVHVRRAIAHSIDREGLAKALFQDNVRLSEALVPRAAWGQTLPKERLDEIYSGVRQYEFDLDKARDELAQSRYADGATGTVWYYNNEVTEKLCVSLAENLKQIGFTLKLTSPTDAEGDSREDEYHDLGFHYDGWGNQVDPIDMIVTLLPSYARKPGLYNFANYVNPTVDKLIEKNLASTHVDERASLIGEILKIVAEDVPYIPVFTFDRFLAVRKGLVYSDYSAQYDKQMWIEHLKVEA